MLGNEYKIKLNIVGVTEKHKTALSDDSFLMLKVMFTTTDKNKVILAECQQSFEYLTTRHCSLVNINTILCADILKSLRKKVKNKKNNNMWQYQQSVETHCPKGSPYNVKGNRKFKHFPCNIVPLFKLPVKKN